MAVSLQQQLWHLTTIVGGRDIFPGIITQSKLWDHLHRKQPRWDPSRNDPVFVQGMCEGEKITNPGESRRKTVCQESGVWLTIKQSRKSEVSISGVDVAAVSPTTPLTPHNI